MRAVHHAELSRCAWPRRPCRQAGARADFVPFHRARVEHLQPAGERAADAGEQLQRLGRLHGADDADQRREHAHGRAAHVLERRVGREHAGIARRAGIARVVDRDLAVEADRRAGDQRLGVRTQAALTAWRVAKLSLQSSTTSASATSAIEQRGDRRARTSACTCTSGLIAAIDAAAPSRLRLPTRARSCAICRCRLVRSTLSWSTMVIRPTPAVPRYSATGEPSPPAPITSACAASKRCWPSMPSSSSRMWRE